MQNMLNVVMRRAGTDSKGKPISPHVKLMLLDDTVHDLFVEAAGPTAMMCRTQDNREMLIPYTSVKYLLP